MSDHYQKEAQALVKEREDRVRFYNSEGARLAAEGEQLQLEIPKTRLIREREQKTQRIQQIQKELEGLQRRNTEEEIRYLRKMVSILQRQQGDPAYSTHRTEIQNAIRQAEVQRRQLESQL
jgi:hypothetical protein